MRPKDPSQRALLGLTGLAPPPAPPPASACSTGPRETSPRAASSRPSSSASASGSQPVGGQAGTGESGAGEAGGQATAVYGHAGAGMLAPVTRAAKPLVYVPDTLSNRVDVIDPSTYKVI